MDARPSDKANGSGSLFDSCAACEPHDGAGLCGKARDYILFHDKRDPREMGVAEIRDYLTLRFPAFGRCGKALGRKGSLKAEL